MCRSSFGEYGGYDAAMWSYIDEESARSILPARTIWTAAESPLLFCRFFFSLIPLLCFTWRMAFMSVIWSEHATNCLRFEPHSLGHILNFEYDPFSNENFPFFFVSHLIDRQFIGRITRWYCCVSSFFFSFVLVYGLCAILQPCPP